MTTPFLHSNLTYATTSTGMKHVNIRTSHQIPADVDGCSLLFFFKLLKHTRFIGNVGSLLRTPWQCRLIPLDWISSIQLPWTFVRTMKYSVEIAYSGSFDASPSIVFKFDSKHYLFNCGEVSQRFFIQHKLKISRIEQLFATKFDWNAIGGIPGKYIPQ
ncbi:hypothetical protein HMI55_001192 [Coelomomyces lativittatus]|nr:hypothetical protein HMI55_001192 [Coelomomyces lativittatus]